MIYADNAATTKLDVEAFEAMKPYLLESYSNPSQPYRFSHESKRAIRESREIVADCIGATPEELFFTSCGTESDNWAIKTGSIGGDIVTSQIEHHAVLNPCRALELQGKNVKYIGVDEKGFINIDELNNNINESTGLVSVMFANNEIGTIQPISDIATIAHKHNCLFHTDAVQAVGHIDIDVSKLGVDMLSASAHKFNGPKGVGFLYIKKGTNLAPFVYGGGQEFGYRAGTENVAGIVAMAVALKNNCKRISENATYFSGLEDKLVKGLQHKGIDFIRNGSPKKIPGNINLSFKDQDGEAILHRMDLMGICISTGSACDSKRTQISHVIKAINVPEDYARGTIRISLGKDNTEEDVDAIVNGLHKIMGKRL